MSAPGRWLRLDVGCFESEWLAALSVPAQHAWTRLLLYTKGNGTAGTVKRMGPVAAARAWGIPPVSLDEMETAALADGALRIEDGWWVLTGWDKYQQPDRTNAIRKQRLRDKRKDAIIPAVSPGTDRSPPGTRHATETVTETKTKKTTTRAAVRGMKLVKWQTCPSDWLGPNDVHRTYADLHHIDLQFQEGQFRRHFFEKPRVSADDTFLTWLENHVAWGKNRTNGNHTPKGAPKVAADGRTLL